MASVRRRAAAFNLVGHARSSSMGQGCYCVKLLLLLFCYLLSSEFIQTCIVAAALFFDRGDPVVSAPVHIPYRTSTCAKDTADQCRSPVASHHPNAPRRSVCCALRHWTRSRRPETGSCPCDWRRRHGLQVETLCDAALPPGGYVVQQPLRTRRLFVLEAEEETLFSNALSRNRGRLSN